VGRDEVVHHALILGGLEFGDVLRATAAQRSAGSHRIATFLRKHEWDVEVVDFLSYWTQEQVLQLFASRITDATKFVAFSTTFFVWKDWLPEIIKWVRSNHPTVKIIVGGPIASTSTIPADYYIEGFGENAILAVVQHMLSKTKLRYTLWNGGKLVRANLDYPAYPLGDLRISYEARDFISEYETLTTELARGCKFKCDFCYFPILGVKGDFSRDADNFRDELQENYDKWGVTSYRIADETINDRTEKLEKFSKAVQELSFTPYLSGFMRGDLLVARPQDREHVLGMRLIGHHYGLESLNAESAKCVGKGMHPEKLMAGLLEFRDWIKARAPYSPTVSLIAGLPHDTADSLRAEVQWFKDNWEECALILFPLYIPKKGSGDNKSLFSENYESYGYSEMQNLEAALSTFKNKAFFDSSWVNKGLFWQKPGMNVLDAVNFVEEFYQQYVAWSRPLIWSLGDYKLAYKRKEDEIVDQKLVRLRPKKMVESVNAFVADYITAKLAATSS
jgi:radical SAM superfamily enzyme YgiQ (UPF0313 family)